MGSATARFDITIKQGSACFAGTGALPKCCAPQLPRQFGEGEHGVFAGDTVPKTLALWLKQSTKGVAEHLKVKRGLDLVLACLGVLLVLPFCPLRGEVCPLEDWWCIDETDS